MSQREFCIVLAHAMQCGACRDRLIQDSASIAIGRSLTGDEKEKLARLTAESFRSPKTLADATSVPVEELAPFAEHPVVRLRHL